MVSVCHALGRGAVRCRAGAGAAACAGPGRAVAGGVRWGGRGVCASGVGARPCRGPHCRVSVGGRRGARGCCAGGVRVGRSRCARRGGGLRPSSRRRARVLAGVSRGLECSACNGLTSVRHVLVGSPLHRRRVSTAECVLRHGVKAVRSQAVQLSFRAAPLLRRRTSRRSMGVLHAGGVGS